MAALPARLEAQEKQRVRWEADIAKTKGQALGVETPSVTARRTTGSAATRRRWPRRRRRVERGPSAHSRRLAGSPAQTRPVLRLAFPAEDGQGEIVVGKRPVASKAASSVLLTACDLTVRAGERIRLDGRNGSGKTTLLRSAGRRTRPGRRHARRPWPGPPPPANPLMRLRTEATVIDFFRSRVPVYVDDAERLLDAQLFPDDTWGSPVRTLSAGELRRLILAVMVNSGATTLLLDEPTNYLDFDSLDVVEEALRAYRGTLIMVTHDTVLRRPRRLHASLGPRRWINVPEPWLDGGARVRCPGLGSRRSRARGRRGRWRARRSRTTAAARQRLTRRGRPPWWAV